MALLDIVGDALYARFKARVLPAVGHRPSDFYLLEE